MLEEDRWGLANCLECGSYMERDHYREMSRRIPVKEVLLAKGKIVFEEMCEKW